jgi:hypothetical protein
MSSTMLQRPGEPRKLTCTVTIDLILSQRPLSRFRFHGVGLKSRVLINAMPLPYVYCCYLSSAVARSVSTRVRVLRISPNFPDTLRCVTWLHKAHGHMLIHQTNYMYKEFMIMTYYDVHYGCTHRNNVDLEYCV